MSQVHNIGEEVARANFMTVEDLEFSLPERDDLGDICRRLWTCAKEKTPESWRAYLEAKQGIEGREN